MVYSRPSVPLSTAAIATQEGGNRLPHLKGIDIPRIEAEIGLQQRTTSYATKGGERKQKRKTFRYAYRSGMDAQWTPRTKRD